MQVENIQNGKYTLNGKFLFDSNVGNLEINAVDALEIAYTLFDYANMDYTVLDEINEILEG